MSYKALINGLLLSVALWALICWLCCPLPVFAATVMTITSGPGGEKGTRLYRVVLDARGCARGSDLTRCPVALDLSLALPPDVMPGSVSTPLKNCAAMAHAPKEYGDEYRLGLACPQPVLGNVTVLTFGLTKPIRPSDILILRCRINEEPCAGEP